MTQLTTPPQSSTTEPKLGRKRDHSRDSDILDAALEVLAQVGYDGMTIDMVAARAKAGKATLYRRWASKELLVIDAVACMKQLDLDPANLPDTGTLRGDLVAMIKPKAVEDGGRKMMVMAGLMSMISRDPGLAEIAHATIMEPRAAANRMFLRRAIERGEIPADIDVEMLATVGPSMTAFRTIMLRKPVTPEFLVAIIDDVVLPAVGLGRHTP